MVRSNSNSDRRVFRIVTVGVLGVLLGITPRPTHAACTGDCDSNGSVTVNEAVTMVSLALEGAGVAGCQAGDADGSGSITVDEIVAAVLNAVGGCAAYPTSTPSPQEPTPQIATPTSIAIASPIATASPTPGSLPTTGAAGNGLSGAITNVVIASNPAGQIQVTFSLTDANGIPVTPVLSAAQSAQQARVRFTVAHVENYPGGGEFNNEFSRYVNDVNMTRPAYDSGGKLTTVDAGSGIYQYTFKTALPAGYDASNTYTVGLQVDRTVNGQPLSANPVYDFVPAGGQPSVRAAVTTQQCNSCHAPLIAHGNRREVRLCLLCHTEAGVDPKGTSIDFRNMIHKLHRGKDLPSVVNGAPGAFYGIFSNFAQQYSVFAQKDANGAVTGIGFPRAIENCGTCHTQGATAAYHRDRPSTAACVACHDDVNPSLVETAAGPPGTKHFQERGYADGDCKFCHIADSGKEFDISVVGAHVIPERSSQLAGLNVEITGVTNHAAGQTPTIGFKASNTAGTILRDLTGLDRLAFAISGPTSDYSVMLTPTAVGGGASGTLTGPDDAGIFQYTPTTAIPATATGTWALGAEARRPVQLAAIDPIMPKTVEESAVNPVVTFTVDDSTALVRRVVVDDQKCGVCHGEFAKDFSIHGNLRNQTEYCVICHNPNQSDQARRKRDPAAVMHADQTTSIDFKVMIHKIHRGEVLEQKPYLIYGFGPAPLNYGINDFADVRFPGDLRICTTCHATGTYLLPPFPGTAQATRIAHLDPATGNEVQDGHVAPITSVCTSCHDGDDALAHADTQTASNGNEACTVCHEEGRAFAVSGLHADRR